MKLRRKIIITYLLVALTPLTLVALLSFTNAHTVLLTIQRRAFENIANFKEIIIKNFYASFQNEMVAVQAYYNIKTNLPILSRLADNIIDSEYVKAKSMLDSQFNVWVNERSGILDLMLVSPDGRIVYSTGSGDQIADTARTLPDPGNHAFEQGRHGIFVSDLFVNARHSGTASFLVSAPIHDYDNNFIGLAVLEVSAQSLYDQIQDTAGLGETGEVLIARRVASDRLIDNQAPTYDEHGDYVLYLNPLRFDPQAAFNRTIRIGAPTAQPVQQAVQNNGNSETGKDYRGKQVFSVWRYLPERNWGMVVKIDTDELLSPLNVLARAILVFSLVAILSVILVAWMISRTISLPITALIDYAKKIGKYEMDISIDKQLLSAPDEVGILAKTLADSAADLRDLHNNLEQKVKDRTEKLEQSETALKAALVESDHINKLLVGRELKMMELKKEISKLSHEN